MSRCTIHQNCSPTEYCDVVIGYCAPCVQLCDPHVDELVQCKRKCTEYYFNRRKPSSANQKLKMEAVSTGMLNNSTNDISHKSGSEVPSFASIFGYSAAIMIVVIVIVLIALLIILLIKRKVNAKSKQIHMNEMKSDNKEQKEVTVEMQPSDMKWENKKSDQQRNESIHENETESLTSPCI